MAQYIARIHGPGGAKEIDLEASSPQEAMVKAARNGRVLSVRERKNFRSGGLNFFERQTFLGRLAAMLGSGVGAGEALRLIRDTFSGRIKRVAHQLLLKIESGMDLAAAIESVGRPDFPENTSALIKAGSVGGSSYTAIREAMNFEREMSVTQKNATKGLMSALFTFLIAAGFNIGSVFYMMPQVMGSDLIKMSGGGKDNRGSVDIGWAVDLADYVGYLMIGIVILIVFLVLLGTVGKKIAPQLSDKLIMKIPVYKDLVLAQKNYIALYGMSLLVRTGVRMEQALDLTAKNTPRGSLRRDLEKACAAVREGKPWAERMSTLHETDRAALMASLDREQVSRALTVIADQYREIYANRIEMMVPAMQAVSGLFMMIAGVIMFGVTILPMMQSMQGIL